MSIIGAHGLVLAIVSWLRILLTQEIANYQSQLANPQHQCTPTMTQHRHHWSPGDKCHDNSQSHQLTHQKKKIKFFSEPTFWAAKELPSNWIDQPNPRYISTLFSWEVSSDFTIIIIPIQYLHLWDGRYEVKIILVVKWLILTGDWMIQRGD